MELSPMEFDKNKQFNAESEVLKVLGHPIRLKIVAGLCIELFVFIEFHWAKLHSYF